MDDLLTLDCSVGEGGGGMIRVALPLSVITQIPVRLVNVRVKRPIESRGIGWVHKCFIDAVCRWTQSHAEYAWGSSEVLFEPGHLARGPLYVDLDDPDLTFATDCVTARRDYLGASDHFVENIDNRGRRGIRGHSVAVFFLGLLPLLCTSELGSSIEVAGATETLGAPFVDATQILFAAAESLVGRRLDLAVVRRGCMGRGGGYVVAKADMATAIGRSVDPWQTFAGTLADEGQPSVVARYYLFGREKWCQEMEQRSVAFVKKLADSLPCAVRREVEITPYPVDRIHVLYLVSSTTAHRDVSFGAEELGAIPFDVARILDRLLPEIRYAGRANRFLAEQMLPLLAVVPGAHTMVTESITPHFSSTATLTQCLTGRSIAVKTCQAGVCISVT